MTDHTPDASPPRPAGRATRVLARPWFWILVIGALWSFPLVESLDRELPEMLPGLDEPPVRFTATHSGREITAEDLRGHLLVMTDMTLADAKTMNETFDDLRRLRKRMRGLGHAALFVVFCHGGDAADLDALLDARKARKPVNVFVLDEDRAAFESVRRQARSRSAAFLVTDSHGRIRGVYGTGEDERDRMLDALGQLANWPAADPPLVEG